MKKLLRSSHQGSYYDFDTVLRNVVKSNKKKIKLGKNLII